MKCDSCKFKQFHPPGSWWSVAEGGDDPYAYDYCQKDHWAGGPEVPTSEEQEGMIDPWIDCEDYESA